MPTILETVDKYSWWAALNHGGLLIAPARLSEFLLVSLFIRAGRKGYEKV